ncbi:cysteine proteinase inhibitor 1-like [Primulina eburnea]|uniref:cysteine proteinase inhibitor 1-like n=1 Tax=Primulina eburnea TaxID=1245227 RepID=UPI003C6C35E5
MALKFRSLILAILPILVASIMYEASAALGGGRGPALGGWMQIKNPQDPQVLGIAKFAVEEHNKQTGEELQFVKVIKGETQVVAGMNYRLVISAKEIGASALKNYEAVVWVKPWQKFRQLTSFVEIN